MKQKILVTMALTVIMSAIAAQAANIQIKYLPYSITAPGTYVLVLDLSYAAQTGAAITILPNLPAPVVLNLKGHALTGSSTPGAGENYSTGVAIFGNGPSASSITIENGTITHFGFGIWAEANTVLSFINVHNLVVSFALTPAGDGSCVLFSQVNSSTVSNCIFNAADYGIRDTLSTGGNRYTNNSFTNMDPLLVTGHNSSAPIVLKDCDFAAPIN